MKPNHMTRSEAFKIDKEFYAELDEGSGFYCVFGDESGFAYESYADEQEAKGAADRKNKEKDLLRSKNNVV